MTRPLRIEYPGAAYHVMARGNARNLIYLDDTDRGHRSSLSRAWLFPDGYGRREGAALLLSEQDNKPGLAIFKIALECLFWGQKRQWNHNMPSANR